MGSQLPPSGPGDGPRPGHQSLLSRRRFLLGGAAGLGALAVSSVLAPPSRAEPLPSLWDLVPGLPLDRAGIDAALAALGRRELRYPGSRPYPGVPAGTDMLPGIDTIVICMFENHSYDNVIGMLRRGDGFRLGRDGQPVAANPYPDGSLQRAFPMPTTCQIGGQLAQDWEQAHIQFNGGRMDGFVRSYSGAASMGYFTPEQLPFTYDLYSKFPIGDRWFCSLLGQTDPNRRYLIAATSAGMTDDIGVTDTVGPGKTEPGLIPDLSLPLPGNGTIFEQLTLFGIPWADYAADTVLGATANLYPVGDAAYDANGQIKPLAQFFSDAADGRLPPVTLIDMNYNTQSQEPPQDVVVGEAFLTQVVEALAASPHWARCMLIVTYDEHGGYYDHVPPPPALPPDLIPPIVEPGEQPYNGFAQFGMRVPSVVVSPYARRGWVTHTVHDHTSIIATIHRKWNLPALTFRDANANDLTDFLDLSALAAGTPTFPRLPALAAPGDTSAALACQATGPGPIPPPG
jgi:phospholipase C